MDLERYNNMTLDELHDAKDEVYNNIQNEKIWMFGSAGDAKAECMHAENVDNLRAELRYILDLIKRKEEWYETLD